MRHIEFARRPPSWTESSLDEHYGRKTLKIHCKLTEFGTGLQYLDASAIAIE